MEFCGKISTALTRNAMRPAVEENGVWRAWNDLKAIGSAIDGELAARGLGRGARIGLVARNHTRHIGVLLGLLSTARTTVMISSAQKPGALAKTIEELRLPAIVADRDDWTDATVAVARSVGTLALAPALGANGHLEIFCESTDTAKDRPAMPTPEIAMEILSSGTTGNPKRIPISWTALQMAAEDAINNFRQTGQAMRGDAPAPLVQPAPLFNIGGLYPVVPAALEGWPLVLLEKFSVEGWLSKVSRHRPLVSWLAPASIKSVWDADVPPGALSSLVGLRTGSAALNPDLQREFEAKYGLAILPAYGATEFCGVVVLWTLEDHAAFAETKRGSTGRARPGVAMRVRDSESAQPMGPGEMGILELKIDRIGTDWIRTTDLASIDEDGFLFLHGRADDAINRGGFKIMPKSVVDVLRRHPAISDAAVVGIKDARLGEVPVAAIELRDREVFDETEIRTFLRGYLPSYQIPAKFRVVAQLPRNASLKVDRSAVRSLFAA